MAVLHFAYRFAVGAWVGAIVAVSFLVAPTVFGSLPRKVAGQVMGQVFSGYYVLGLVLGLIALAALVALAMSGGWSRDRVAAAVLLVLMVAGAGYARARLVPAVLEARDAVYAAPEGAPVDRARLDRLHHLSVGLNGGVLLCGLTVLVLGAVRDQRLERGTGRAA